MYPIKTSAKYDPKNLAKLCNIYTTAYLGNYIVGDYDEGVGSHPGVDIVPMTPNDAVYAVLPGVIEEAKQNASEGNFVIICHKDIVHPETGKKGTYYSCYLHLSELSVTKGQIVAEGDIIGKTGNTGMSTGEHLHFQIDTAEALFHPYWPFTFKEAKDLNLGFMEAVNKGLGLENAQKFTVGPLVFLDQIAANGGVTTTSNTTTSPIIPSTSTTTTTATISASTTISETHIASSTNVVSPFSDVSANSPHLEAITYLKNNQIANGQNGKFSPKANITRGELLKMVFLASKTPISTDTNSTFSDVAAGNSLLPYINTAKELKAVSGYPDGTFKPNNPVTRAEGLKIILKVMNVSLESVDGPVYADVGKTDWFAPQALWSRDNEVLTAQGSNFFPNVPLSREEVAEIIYRAK